MKNIQNKKGFTLVELIIVITILAILGTIGFVSFQGYTSDARNTKRTADLSSIQSALEARRAGTSMSVINFVDDNITSYISPTTFNIAGISITSTGSNYNAGILNYSILGVSEDDFRDPNGDHYSFGATTLQGGKIQLAATLEGENPTALVRGDYISREQADTVTEGNIANRNPRIFELTDISDMGNLIIGDIIEYSNDNVTYANTGAIISIDSGRITMDGEITAGTTNIRLASGNEIFGLIGNYGNGDGSTAVTNGGNDLPY